MLDPISKILRDEPHEMRWQSRLDLVSNTRSRQSAIDEDRCGGVRVRRKACQSLTAKAEVKLRPASIETLNKLEALASEEAILLRFDYAAAEIVKEVNDFAVDCDLEEM